MMNFIILIFTFFSCVRSKNYNDDNWPTQVIYKTGEITKTINSNNDASFLQFIQLSTLWVDKSELIASIWSICENPNINVYIITAPTRWGKTTNLKMIKFYHQPEVDEHGDVVISTQTAAYKYFVEGIVVKSPGFQPERINVSPKISKFQKLNDEHLAAHPVITLDGSSLNIKNPRSIRMMISRAFNEYWYLAQKWRKNADLYADELEDFDKYVDDDGSIPLDEFINGIVDLSSLLVRTYKRHVIILYDEHDAYLHKAYFRQDGSPFEKSAQSEVFSETLEDFMHYTFKRNPHLIKGVITGVLGVNQATVLSMLNNVHNGNVFTDSYIFPFYGIFQREFESAAKVANLNFELIDNATKWYDGYRVLNHPNEPMYSTYSISNYITNKDVQNYWTDSSSAKFIPKLFNQPQFREDIMQLIKEESKTGLAISRRNLDKFEIEDLALIQRLYLGIELYDRMEHRDVVFSLLISIGFATFHHVDKNDIEIRLPNWEIRNYMNTKWLYFMKINQDDGG